MSTEGRNESLGAGEGRSGGSFSTSLFLFLSYAYGSVIDENALDILEEKMMAIWNLR